MTSGSPSDEFAAFARVRWRALWRAAWLLTGLEHLRLTPLLRDLVTEETS